MLILIEKDPATKIPREVSGPDEAASFAAQGFVVHVVAEDGSTSLFAEQAAPLSAASNDKERVNEEEQGQGRQRKRKGPQTKE